MSEMSLAVVAVFASVALASGSLAAYVLGRTAPSRRRLDALAGAQVDRLMDGGARLAETSADTVKKVATFVPKSPKELSRLQRRLANAGYHGTFPLVIYCFAEIAAAAGCFFAVVAVLGWRGVFFAGAAAFLGYVLPGFYVHRKVALRKKQIQNGLPDALDLFIVCLEAGMGLDQAILKASEELEVSYPLLSDELRLINIETRAGKPRLEALKNFSKRTQVDDVRALVAMLVQTDRFGTSIGQALRTHAEEARMKRRQRAEEKAAKLGVKLVFPLVFCLLPAFFVVSLGPGIIKLVHFFGRNPRVGGFQ